jgi:hypothetical protein
VLIGEIEAGPKVPFAKVLDVMGLFVDHQVTTVRLMDTATPGAKQRQSERLPFPVKNPETPDGTKGS